MFCFQLSQLKNVPFFLEASHLACKIKKSSPNEIIKYMDWCWELNHEAFIKLLVEILEIGDPTLRNVSISWIVEALKLDDRILLEFTRHSCGRIRDICIHHPEFSTPFISALQEVSDRNGHIEKSHRSNLERHIKCLRLSGLMPS
ncbi:unnamed protein product [Hymenolepis diminuta]|uniref:Uncharacterized protein n=1 Tax=Hymenolepis diminuta TaxID=6216 RepID=A0A564YHI5_HYMDI|nr:unnamed protein product [Hymenolepis diminuta]